MLEMIGAGSGTPHATISTLSNEIFGFTLSDPTSIATGTYSSATLSSSTTAIGSLAQEGSVSGPQWALNIHETPNLDTGSFTLVINELTSIAGSSGSYIHGTLDVILEPVAGSGASGTVTVHVVAP